jgi:hypothetical protein
MIETLDQIKLVRESCLQEILFFSHTLIDFACWESTIFDSYVICLSLQQKKWCFFKPPHYLHLINFLCEISISCFLLCFQGWLLDYIYQKVSAARLSPLHHQVNLLVQSDLCLIETVDDIPQIPYHSHLSPPNLRNSIPFWT